MEPNNLSSMACGLGRTAADNAVKATTLPYQVIRYFAARSRKSFLFGYAGRGGMFGASLFPLIHPTIVRKHNLGALGTSRTA
jgi:hypothetical protein